MPSLKRRKFLQVGGILGLSAFAIEKVTSTGTDLPKKDHSSNTGLGIASSGTSCLENSENTNSGWIHTVADGESYDLTFDVRVAHSSSEKVQVDLSSTPETGEYVFDLTIKSADDEYQENKSGCTIGTRLIGGGNLPNDFETLLVTLNEKSIQSIERDGTTPTLYTLPNPIKNGKN